MSSKDERIDLSPLDPEVDPNRIERVVDGVLGRLGPGIVRDESSSVEATSPLDPEGDPHRLDRIVDGVLGRLEPETAPDELSVIDEVSVLLARHARLIAATAALLVLVASAVLLDGSRRSDVAGPAANTAVDAPSAWEGWLVTGQPPRTEDLLLGLPGGAR